MKRRWITVVLCITVLLCGLWRGLPDTSLQVQAAAKVSLNKKKVSLKIGETYKLVLKGTDKKVTWKSADTEIATVSKSGKVKGKGIGTTKITAKAGGKRYTCKVTVKKGNDKARQVWKLVNKERKKAGLDAVSYDSRLNKAAGKRAKELVEQFDHIRPDGKMCFTILEDEGIAYMTCGENIAAGQAGAERVMECWMDSPGHKANILNGSFCKMGVGYYQSDTAPYKYYWVQIFTD